MQKNKLRYKQNEIEVKRSICEQVKGLLRSQLLMEIHLKAS